MTTETLLPCPFCGGSAEIQGLRAHYVICLACEAQGAFMTTKAEAARAWNQRTLAPHTAHGETPA